MMNIPEQNQTRKWIIAALFDLLQNRDYHAITIAQITDKAGLGRRTFYRYFQTKDEVIKYTTELLMDELALTFMENHVDSLYSVAVSYFQFWENYVDVLLLLEKARLLHFIEESLPSLIHKAAQKTGHYPQELSQEEIALIREQSKYEFAFKLAGFWSVTLVWCSEKNRKTPAEMATLIAEMLKNK